MADYRLINHKLEKFQIIKRTALFGLFGEGENKLHFGQIPVLEYVMKHDGCTQIELAEFLGVSPASIAVSTKRMQKSGLLDKKEDENNLRCKNLFITDKGREIFLFCKSHFDSFDKMVYNGITDEELEIFCRVIDKMTINLTGDKENTISPGELLRLRPNRTICDCINECDRRTE